VELGTCEGEMSPFVVGDDDGLVMEGQSLTAAVGPAMAQAVITAVTGAVETLPDKRQWPRQEGIFERQHFFTGYHADGAATSLCLRIICCSGGGIVGNLGGLRLFDGIAVPRAFLF